MGNRYSKIDEENRREIVLLKSYPCAYGKCSFCNYIEDNTRDEKLMESVNFETLDEVTGEYGSLEVINSGSVFELPRTTLEKIREIVEKKNIGILYFEIYY
ncbi:MAG: radical SAM protein, partial [Fusobacteriaceae bacterium]